MICLKSGIRDPAQDVKGAGGDRKPRLDELPLGGEPLRVGGEVALRMRPADLVSPRVQVAVGPSAVRAGDARATVRDQRPRLAPILLLREVSKNTPAAARPRGQAGPRRVPGHPWSDALRTQASSMRSASSLKASITYAMRETLAACSVRATRSARFTVSKRKLRAPAMNWVRPVRSLSMKV